MKFVTFRNGDSRTLLGAECADGRIADLAAVELVLEGQQGGCFAGMQELIEAGPDALRHAQSLCDQADQSTSYDAAGVTLLAPLPIPVQMRDFMSFEKHLQQSMVTMAKLRAQATGATDMDAVLAEAQEVGALTIPQVWYDQPIYYKANRFAISGPGGDILWPSYSRLMDYECELACVIGVGGKDISESRAHEHIFGFTILNDFSARDAQMIEMQGFLGPAKGKDFDGANAMGPCLVTADEVGDSKNLQMIVRVNGVERSRGSSSDMHWSFEQMIAWISRDETIYPGEILGSGTVGDGCGLEHGAFLNDNDVIELEIEGIGILRNAVRKSS